jgi:hypothetical protein
LSLTTLSGDSGAGSATILSSHRFNRSSDSAAMSTPLVEPLRQMTWLSVRLFALMRRARTIWSSIWS